MTDKEKKTRDADLEKAGAALQRAALRAREIARQTGTPLVIYRDGQIVKEFVDQKTE
jgi:hypothetical protein